MLVSIYLYRRSFLSPKPYQMLPCFIRASKGLGIFLKFLTGDTQFSYVKKAISSLYFHGAGLSLEKIDTLRKWGREWPVLFRQKCDGRKLEVTQLLRSLLTGKKAFSSSLSSRPGTQRLSDKGHTSKVWKVCGMSKLIGRVSWFFFRG